MSSWRLDFVHAWPTQNKMLCMIWYMLRYTHLHERYDKSDFFSSILFHYWVAFTIKINISKIEQTVLLEIPCQIFFLFTIFVYQLIFVLSIPFSFCRNIAVVYWVVTESLSLLNEWKLKVAYQQVAFFFGSSVSVDFCC